MGDGGRRPIWLSYNLTKTTVSQHFLDRVCQGLAVERKVRQRELGKVERGGERKRRTEGK